MYKRFSQKSLTPSERTQQMLNQKINTIKIKQTSSSTQKFLCLNYLWQNLRSVKPKSLILFTQQLAALLKAGISMINGLHLLADNTPDKKLAVVIQLLTRHIENGMTFFQAISTQPKIFNALYRQLIQTGEQTGALEISLEQIAIYQKSASDARQKLKKALLYPGIVLSAGILITAIILVFVVPQFQNLFNGFGGELPTLTLMVITLSNFVRINFITILLSLIGCAIMLRQSYYKFTFWRKCCNLGKLYVPILGNIFKQNAIAHFARSLATTFSAGVPILTGLKLLADTIEEPAFAQIAKQACIEIEQGKSLHQALRFYRLVPNLTIQMVQIGEESGQLDQMLYAIANYYEEQAKQTMETMHTLIEPILMLMLGLLIGTLIIALYLPVFSLGSIL